MAQAKRDQNRIPTLIGVSTVDGTTPLPVFANPTTHALTASLSVGIMPLEDKASIDENRVKSLLGVSSVDEITPIPIGVNSSDNGLLMEEV